MSPFDLFVEFLWWYSQDIEGRHLGLAVVADLFVDKEAEGEEVEEKFAGWYLWIFSSGIKDKIQDGLSDQIL